MAVLDPVTVERIRLEAAQLHFGRTALLSVAAVLFAIGWVAAKTLGVAWLGISWALAACKVGWQSARTGGGGS